MGINTFWKKHCIVQISFLLAVFHRTLIVLQVSSVKYAGDRLAFITGAAERVWNHRTNRLFKTSYVMVKATFQRNLSVQLQTYRLPIPGKMTVTSSMSPETPGSSECNKYTSS